MLLCNKLIILLLRKLALLSRKQLQTLTIGLINQAVSIKLTKYISNTYISKTIINTHKKTVKVCVNLLVSKVNKAVAKEKRLPFGSPIKYLSDDILMLGVHLIYIKLCTIY